VHLTAQGYQIDAARFLTGSPGSLLLADPGTGKSAITLITIRELMARGLVDLPVLLVAPLRVAQGVWGQEIRKWDQFHDLEYQVLYGKTRDIPSNAPIQITNFDSLEPMASRGLLRKFRTLIIDEVSKTRNPRGVKYKILQDIASRCTRRHGLTGSPRPRALLDIWGPLYLTAGGGPLGYDYFAFRRKYFFDRNDLLGKWVDHTLGDGSRMLPERQLLDLFNLEFPGSDQGGLLRAYYRMKYVSGQLKCAHIWPDWRPIPGAEEEIHRLVAPYCFRLDITRVLDLPPVTIRDVPVLLPTKYRKISATTALEIVGDPLAHQNKYMLSRRAAAGITPDGILHNAKIEALDDLILELQGQHAIVFFAYRAEGAYLAAKYQAPLVYGGTGDKAFEFFEQWNRGELPLLFLQAASCGHGLNLQAGGRHVIYFSLTDNYDDYDQGFRRVWRKGVTGPVFVHRLIGIGSIDEAIRDSLDLDKGEGQKAFNDAIWRLKCQEKYVA
jgi:SNF2 family DNA or RNA helicase